jgi:hypothetical protein
VRASDGKGEGAAEVPKALRRTERPEVLRGQLAYYDDTETLYWGFWTWPLQMQAAREFYTALRGRVLRLTRLSPKDFEFYTGYHRGKGLQVLGRHRVGLY